MQGPIKRGSKRIKGNYILRFRIKGEPNWNMVLLDNLGAKGIYFKFDKKLKIGSILDMKITLPISDKPLNCAGKVVRVEKTSRPSTHGIAIAFLV